MSNVRLIPVCLLALCLSSSARATVWTVHPDGTGDAPTIQAAVDSCADVGDVVELSDGTYTGNGNRDISIYDRLILIRSQSDDPTACIIDLEGSLEDPHKGFLFSGDG